MNQLTVRVADAELEDGGAYRAVQLLVDGDSLIKLVQRVEEPLARREGHPDLAGAYAWLGTSSMARHELAAGAEDEDEKVALLVCSCGVPGCWPLLAKVTVSASHVTWSEFEQPHRSEEAAAGHWTYEALGPFVFDRPDYENQLKEID